MADEFLIGRAVNICSLCSSEDIIPDYPDDVGYCNQCKQDVLLSSKIAGDEKICLVINANDSRSLCKKWAAGNCLRVDEYLQQKRRDACFRCYLELQQAVARGHPPRCPPAPIFKTLIPIAVGMLCMLASVIVTGLDKNIGSNTFSHIALGLMAGAGVFSFISVTWLHYTIRKHQNEWIKSGGWPYF